MKTMIVSAFPGCGKTYLGENQDKLEFNFKGEKRKFSFLDSDSSHYKKHDGWEKEYIDDIETKLGTVDFIFISQHDKVLEELDSRKIPFVTVTPNNSESISEEERKLIKQQWFGRFVLRDNSHIYNFTDWLESLKKNYDAWTSVDELVKYHPQKLYLLKENEYISNIIEELYYDKEK